MVVIPHIAFPEQPADTRRHLVVLARAIETGADLGPRSLHIRSLDSSLKRMLMELQREQEARLALPEAELFETRTLLNDVPDHVAVLKPLVALARTFPNLITA